MLNSGEPKCVYMPAVWVALANFKPTAGADRNAIRISLFGISRASKDSFSQSVYSFADLADFSRLDFINLISI